MTWYIILIAVVYLLCGLTVGTVVGALYLKSNPVGTRRYDPGELWFQISMSTIVWPAIVIAFIFIGPLLGLKKLILASAIRLSEKL